MEIKYIKKNNIDSGTALITGASSGIGEAFAEMLAKEGYNLVLVARNIDKLNSLSSSLSEKYGIKAYVYGQDLSESNAVSNIHKFTQEKEITIDLLINNAGHGDVGGFIDHSMAEHNAMISSMLTALVELTHVYLPDMVARKDGAIINVASVVGLMGTSLNMMVKRSLYRPIKSFVIAFTEQLDVAYRSTGVRFQCLCPGLTISDFHKRVGQEDLYDKLPSFMWLTSEEVARRSLIGLRKKKKLVFVTGFINKLGIFFHRLCSLFS
ncbi:MAG: SDR family oxidoreductase [Pseudomonadota bacterium]|nr:SDR family oxidoreductase [Pseudomonadota bacterium]